MSEKFRNTAHMKGGLFQSPNTVTKYLFSLLCLPWCLFILKKTPTMCLSHVTHHLELLPSKT